MSSDSLKRGRQIRWSAVCLGTLITLLAVVACGGGGEAADAWEFQKVDPSDQVYTIDDFLAAGFKKDKQYDVEGLPEAVDAYLGFWGLDINERKDYELRFYASHEDAVEYGTPLAEEGSGEGMIANRKTQTWQEGAKHRWFAGGVKGIAAALSKSDPRPRFGGFAVSGNVVMLCEGADPAHALERCSGLAEALRKATGD